VKFAQKISLQNGQRKKGPQQNGPRKSGRAIKSCIQLRVPFGWVSVHLLKKWRHFVNPKTFWREGVGKLRLAKASI